MKSVQDGCLFGHHDDTLYGYEWENQPDRSDTKDVCGDYPAVLSLDIRPLERISEQERIQHLQQLREETIRHDQRGGIIVFSWHGDNIVTNGNAWDVSDSTTVKKILNDPVIREKYLYWVDVVSDFFKSLKRTDGTTIPVVFRPYHENNGAHFWWGSKCASPKEYKTLWKLLVKRFRRNKVRNLLYAYSPGSTFKDETDYLQRYPGNKYVDILGFDCYCLHDARRTPEEDRIAYVKRADSSLSLITEIAKKRHKLVAFTETGIKYVDDEQWWTEGLLPLLSKYPVTYVVVWRNATRNDAECWGVYPGHSSESDFKLFHKSPITKFCKSISL